MSESKAKKNSVQARRWSAVVLAAGKGTRMNSPLPKVLHPVAGRPMLSFVLDACERAEASEIRVVVGHGANLVKAAFASSRASWHPQAQQMGTADAVKSAHVESLEGDVCILNGDHPLLKAEDLQIAYQKFQQLSADVAVVTCHLPHPGDFGRVVRHHGELQAIVEAKDASADTLKIQEINTGIYFARAEILQELLPRIQNHNAKKEFYLTDLVSLCAENQYIIKGIAASPRVAFGVNTQAQLAIATQRIFRRKRKEMLAAGVLLLDPKSCFVESSVEVAAGSVLYPNVFLRGSTTVGAFTAIESNCYLVDSKIGSSVTIKANSYIEGAVVGSRVSLGPFARIRPETEIGDEAHVGNFVEMKKVKFGKGAKANHLTYLGDAEVGEETNIGCGTITCNYAVDRKKYKTIIGKRVFVGSDSQFVAPLHIGDDAVIGSGSTITKDVPERALAVARGRQVVIENYNKKKDEGT